MEMQLFHPLLKKLAPVRFVYNVDDLPTFHHYPVFSDIETAKLYVGTRLIQFYCPWVDEAIYILDVAPEGYDEIEWAVEVGRVKRHIGKMHTVWYNASYDLGTLNISPENVDDLFYAVKTAYPQYQEFGLAKVTDKHPVLKGLYDGLDKAKLQKAGFKPGAYLSHDQIKYSATDVLALHILWEDEKVKNVVENNKAYEIDMLSQKFALIYQQNGLIVNHELRREKLSEARGKVIKYTNLLPDGMNVNSYKQVRAHLGIDKSDNEALVAYKHSDADNAKDAEYIIELKKARKQVSYLESLDHDKMVTKFNVAGAVTGRYTSSGGDLDNGFNAQQIPHEFQELFELPHNDTVVIEADYSTLELRLAAAIFKDEYMYEQLKNGEDLHTAMALKVTGKKLHPDGIIDTWDKDGEYLTKANRTDAKCINFGFVFGMSAATFVPYALTNYGVKFSIAEANRVRRTYFNMYKQIAKHHDYIWRNYKKAHFFVETALGRVVKPRLGTDGINIPVQGSGAEATKLAVIELVRANDQALDYIFNVVHDSIKLRVPRDEADYWADLLHKSMLKGWEAICQTDIMHYKDIPIGTDVEIHGVDYG